MGKKADERALAELTPQTTFQGIDTTQDIVLCTVVAALPAFFYFAVLMAYNVSPLPWAAGFPAGIAATALLLFLSVRKQTYKTFLRYAEEMRNLNERPTVKKELMPTEEQRNVVVWKQASMYAYSAINLIYFALFFLLHFKFFSNFSIPPEVAFACSSTIPALLCFVIS